MPPTDRDRNETSPKITDNRAAQGIIVTKAALRKRSRLFFHNSRGHDRRDTAAIPQYEGNDCFSMQPHAVHKRIRQECDSGKIANIF